MVLGAAMLLCAAGLLLKNRQESSQAQSASAQVLQHMQASEPIQISDAAEPERGAEAPQEDSLPETLTLRNIDGYDYIGTLTIPDLDLELPVMDQWSYASLRIAPGRFSGSPYTGDLVLCAHNYPGHFGRLGTLDMDSEIRFQDFDGTVWVYRLRSQEILQPESIEEMVSQENDPWDLTLFTCTPGGQTRAAYRCTLTEMLPA